MKPSECEQLDDYLDGELAEADARAFERHAARCGVCERAIRQSNGLSRLLASAYRTSLYEETAAPADHRPASRARVAACLAALIATILAWTALPVLWREDSRHQLEPPSVARGSRELAGGSRVANESVQRPKMADIQVVNSEEVLAVPVPSHRENVTIVWMYPTVRAAAEERNVFGRLK
jgi:anti-sigma factor RsiW